MRARIPVFLAVGLVISALLPASSAAQLPGVGMPGRRLLRVGFGGGISVPTSDAADALDNGINGQAYLLVDTGFLPPLRFNLGYQRFDFKQALLAGATGHSSILSGVAGISVDLLQLGPVRPYVTAGVGGFHISDELDTGGTAQLESTSSTRFGIDGGAGIALRIGRLEGFIEARLQNVYTEAGVIDTKTIRSVPVTFGILF